MSDDPKKKDMQEGYKAILDIVLMLGGSSVTASAVQTLIGASDAFNRGLINANHSHAAISTVQLQALTDCVIAMRRPIAAPAVAATAGYMAGANSGAPVVT